MPLSLEFLLILNIEINFPPFVCSNSIHTPYFQNGSLFHSSLVKNQSSPFLILKRKPGKIVIDKNDILKNSHK